MLPNIPWPSFLTNWRESLGTSQTSFDIVNVVGFGLGHGWVNKQQRPSEFSLNILVLF